MTEDFQFIGELGREIDLGNEDIAALRAENARLLQSALASQRDADKLLEKLHAAERENAALIDLIQHMWVHSSYPECGYMAMTTTQKEMFDRVKHRG